MKKIIYLFIIIINGTFLFAQDNHDSLEVKLNLLSNAKVIYLLQDSIVVKNNKSLISLEEFPLKSIMNFFDESEDEYVVANCFVNLLNRGYVFQDYNFIYKFTKNPELVYVYDFGEKVTLIELFLRGLSSGKFKTFKSFKVEKKNIFIKLIRLPSKPAFYGYVVENIEPYDEVYNELLRLYNEGFGRAIIPLYAYDNIEVEKLVITTLTIGGKNLNYVLAAISDNPKLKYLSNLKVLYYFYGRNKKSMGKREYNVMKAIFSFNSLASMNVLCDGLNHCVRKKKNLFFEYLEDIILMEYLEKGLRKEEMPLCIGEIYNNIRTEPFNED